MSRRNKELVSATPPTLLAAGITWTSDPFDVFDAGWHFDRVTGGVMMSQDGTLTVEQSWDGVNWDYVKTEAITASTGLAFSYELIGRKVRYKITNGGGIPLTVNRSKIFGRSDG